MFASLHTWFHKRWQRKPTTARRAVPHFEALEDRWAPAYFTYQGGALLSHVEVQGVYYGPRWSKATNQSQVSYLDGFLNTIVQSSYLDTLTNAGYGVGRGTASPGKVLSRGMTHGRIITDHQIQQVLLLDIRKGQLQTPDANRLYVVFVQPGTFVRLPHGVRSPADVAFYHATIHARGKGGQSLAINYAVVPSPPKNLPRLSTLDTLTTLTSEVLVNAVTDPGGKPNQDGSGWNYISGDEEVGDYLDNEYVYVDGYAVQRLPNQNGNFTTPAGATASATVSFVLQSNADLVEQTASGSQKVLGNVASVSAQGIDIAGRAMVDVILTDGEAYEVHDGGPPRFLDKGVKQAQAGQVDSFVLLQDGTLEFFFSQYGPTTLSVPGKNTPKVTSFTVGQDLSGATVVDAVFADGSTKTFSQF
jgi:hypothetical protein